MVPREGDLLARGHTAPESVAWNSPTGPQQAFTERQLWAWPLASWAILVTAVLARRGDLRGLPEGAAFHPGSCPRLRGGDTGIGHARHLIQSVLAQDRRSVNAPAWARAGLNGVRSKPMSTQSLGMQLCLDIRSLQK